MVCARLDGARVYAQRTGKRLPAELEWQYAAEGPEALLDPWGSQMLPGRCYSGQNGGTATVKSFSELRPPFGCSDICGNAWDWTGSEYSDGRTRSAMLRGGSDDKAQGSVWYTGGGPQCCRFGMQFLLMWPGLDCGAVPLK